MSFSELIEILPEPVDAERGAEAAARVETRDAKIASLIAGAAGNSPYLDRLIETETEWLRDAVLRHPDDALRDLLKPVDDISIDQLASELRLRKRRCALIVGLADLGGVWDLQRTTAALSHFADFAVQTGLRAILRHEFRMGKLGPCTEADLEHDCGMVVLGMGKLGAHELNYSSDIDLIVLFDESRFEEADYARVRKGFIRVTQALVKLLSEKTVDGYVFRTDLRLRPNPSVTPVCIAMEPAEHYYESVGRTWERAAMIKARPIAGDLVAGAAFLERLTPFVWRKYLDFTAIKNAQDMLHKIRDQKNLHDVARFEGRDIKLGQGGIREIEFFAQTHQLIFGGRNGDLRSSRTLATLAALQQAGLIDVATERDLAESYVWLRNLEHRIQILDDMQTHQIPASDTQLQRVARMLGHADVAALKDRLLATVQRVHTATELAEEATEDADTPVVDTGAEDLLATFEAGWFELPAFRSQRAKELYAEVRGSLLSKISELGDKETILRRFDQFLSALPAGVQLFSLFAARPSLLELVIDVCGVSPQLADFLGRESGVLDAVLDRDFFQPFVGLDELTQQLKERLDPVEDYEETLNELRRWQKELHFRNGVHLLRRISRPHEAGQAYSNIAEASVAAILPKVQEHLAQRYGPPPGRGVCVLAMGKLGSSEMTATSDLDLIVIYDADGEIETSGPKQIAVGTYYARLTQALVSGLTAQTSEGHLYEVDLRLRPSGRQGPVATSLASFAEYQAKAAWTWEHLALVRARVVAGPEDLASDIAATIETVLKIDRDPASVLNDVTEMRARLEKSFDESSASVWQTKRGEGRLMDIELLLQAGALLAPQVGARSASELVPALKHSGWLNESDADTLAHAHAILSDFQHVERLVGPSFDPETADSRLESLLCWAVQTDTLDDAKSSILGLVEETNRILSQKLAVGDAG